MDRLKKILNLVMILSLLSFSTTFAFDASSIDVNVDVSENYELNKDMILKQIGANPKSEFTKQIREEILAREKVLENEDVDFYDIDVLLFSKENHQNMLQIDDIGQLSDDMNAVIIDKILSGDTQGNLTLRITYSGYINQQADDVVIDAYLKKSATRNGVFNQHSHKTQTLQYLETLELKISSETGFWKGTYTGAVYDFWWFPLGSVQGETKVILYNKKGTPYLVYTDPHSGIVMKEPDRADWPKQSPLESWTATDRANYKNWYNTVYGEPSWDWGDYDIHHIRPLSRGGTNTYSNLIPLPRWYHQLMVTAWWNSY